MNGAQETGIAEVAVQVSEELKQTIEVLIFASDETLSVKMIRDVIDEGNQQREPSGRLEASNEDVRAAVVLLNREYEEAHRSFRIMQLAGGYVFATNKKFSMWVGKLFKEKARRKLSATALETLAIVAYKQPITKSEVEFIRGVNADYIMKTLLEKNLITIVGRATTPGRPLLYGTTPEFLKHFGINEITDLPKPREIEELIGETELEVDKRLLAEQQEVEFKEQLQENMTPEQRKEKSGGKKNAAPARQKAPVAQSEQQAIADAQARTEPVASAEDVPSGAIEENASAAVESVAEAPHVEQPEMPGALPVEADHKNVEDMTAEEVSSVEEQAGEIGSRIDVHAVVPVGEPVGPDQSGDQPQKGWSKWKTKLQTFFRKLFA